MPETGTDEEGLSDKVIFEQWPDRGSERSQVALWGRAVETVAYTLERRLLVPGKSHCIWKFQMCRIKK